MKQLVPVASNGKNALTMLTLSMIIYSGCTVPRQSKDDLIKRAFLSENYRLVWSDEFDKDGTPDPKNWSFESGFVRNQEAQWYQHENAYCRDGMLVIEGRKETKPNPLYQEGSTSWPTKDKNIHYTSASLNTRGLHAWQYGRFVMRGKIDISPGLWPAWWTLGIEGNWPANGEIDIMEYYRNKLLANIACAGSHQQPEWFSNSVPLDSIGGKQWATKFHIWRMDWDKEKIMVN